MEALPHISATLRSDFRPPHCPGKRILSSQSDIQKLCHRKIYTCQILHTNGVMVSSKSSIVTKLRTSETHIETIMIVATTGKNIHHPLRPVSCNRLIDIGMVTSQNGGRKFDMK